MLRSKRVGWVAAFVTASVLCISEPARAEGSNVDGFMGIWDAVYILPGVALSIPNIVHIAKWERPQAWPVVSIVMGSIGSAVTAFLTSGAIQEHPSSTWPFYVGWTGCAVMLGSGVWALALPEPAAEKAHARVRPVPVMMQGARGQLVGGIGATVTGF